MYTSSHKRKSYPYVKSTGVYKCPSNSSKFTEPDNNTGGQDVVGFGGTVPYPNAGFISMDYVPYSDSNGTTETLNVGGQATTPFGVGHSDNGGGGNPSNTFLAPMTLGATIQPSNLILLSENTNQWRAGTNIANNSILFAGHTGQSNFLFTDGHVKSMKPTATCGPGNTNTMWWNQNGTTPCTAGTMTSLAATQAANQ